MLFLLILKGVYIFAKKILLWKFLLLDTDIVYILVQKIDKLIWIFLSVL